MVLNPEELAAELLARTRQIPINEVDQMLTTATAAIVDLGVADSASVTERVGNHEFRTRGATDDRAAAADRLQYELHEGPCIEAAYEDGLVSSNDVSVDPRWPRWGTAASGVGVGAVISVQLYVHEDTMGALNLFYAQRRDLTADDLEVAQLVAVPISIELAHSRQDEHLWKAIDARHRIGQAQGILMHQFGISENEAFAVLRRLSQEHNTKLHLIADQMVRRGQFPTELGAPGS